MILGITPARGGSKGVPRKNVKPLFGKPLIAWTIDAAQRSKLLDRYMVSTEDAEIKQIAESHGAEVLLRPADLATDTTTTFAVLEHVLSVLPSDIVVILQCTSPVRDHGLIDACISRFEDSGADSLATGFMCHFQEWGTYTGRRQEKRHFFYDDGNVYVLKAENILNKNPWGHKREQMITSREQNVEIDDELDFLISETILKKRLQH